jgi:hypothetical protein
MGLNLDLIHSIEQFLEGLLSCLNLQVIKIDIDTWVVGACSSQFPSIYEELKKKELNLVPSDYITREASRMCSYKLVDTWRCGLSFCTSYHGVLILL